MDKVTLLKQRAARFRDLLQQYEETDTDAMLLLRWPTPLFQEIESGSIQPPKYYDFRNALGKDGPFYEPDKPFFGVEAEFVAALEDWESQDWYKQLTS